MYERSDYIGGRSTTVHAFEDPESSLELGGSIFVEVNRNLVSTAKGLGLRLQEAGATRPKEAAEALGIWDGLEFRFLQKQSSYWWYDLGLLLWKYGTAPIRTQMLMKKTVNTFLKMYEEPTFPFDSLSSAAKSLGLTEATSKTGQAFLERNGISMAFSSDIVQASTRVNYAQDLQQLHGLETMVCMATSGAMAVQGGNFQIFEGMLASAGAEVKLNTTVVSIAQNNKGSYMVQSAASGFQKGPDQLREEAFDAVVIAAPFGFSNISISPSSIRTPEPVSYVQLFVTLFTSSHQLNPDFFGRGSDESVPEVVLTTEPEKVTAKEPPFISISTLRKVRNPNTSQEEYAYKIFSKAPLTSAFLSSLLGFEDPKVPLHEMPKANLSWVYEKTWHSYPYLHPRTLFPELKLDENLYYTGGIESFISTMETSSLMGQNVAKLLANSWLSSEQPRMHTEI